MIKEYFKVEKNCSKRPDEFQLPGELGFLFDAGPRAMIVRNSMANLFVHENMEKIGHVIKDQINVVFAELRREVEIQKFNSS